MNYNDKIMLNKDVSEAYKQLVKPIYVKYSNYSSAEIREEISHWIITHNHQRNIELFSKRKRRKIKIKKVKEQIKNIEIKQQLEDFALSLEI